MLLFDTHCHLNFKTFNKTVDKTIKQAKNVGLENILIPGTDIKNSKKAVEIASNHPGVYAAAGIHPHHAINIKIKRWKIKNVLQELEKLLLNKVVVAVGEVGLDKHVYIKTKYEKYEKYRVDDGFIKRQITLLEKQIKLSIKHNKSLILHNRNAADDLLSILEKNWSQRLAGKTVFHCCEPNDKLLSFAVDNHVYIGVDGDVTFDKNKQDFVKRVPLNLLVLETDSPFLLPEPLLSKKKYPNQPANLRLIAVFVAGLLNLPVDKLVYTTNQNSKELFSLT